MNDVYEVDPDNVDLTEGTLGFNILVNEESVGFIEGVPGKIQHFVIEMHWEGKGVARAALNEFVSLSQDHGISEVITNNATHPAMEHILETEGFKKQSDDIGLVKEV